MSKRCQPDVAQKADARPTWTLQLKAGGQQRPHAPQAKPHPSAPPVYRPQPTAKVLQAKAGPSAAGLSAAQTGRRPPAAPPVYRPQPAPRVLQTKSAGGRLPEAVVDPNARPCRGAHAPRQAIQSPEGPRACPPRGRPATLQAKGLPGGQTFARAVRPTAVLAAPRPRPAPSPYRPPSPPSRPAPAARPPSVPQGGGAVQRKSYLYLGAGDHRTPLRKTKKHSQLDMGKVNNSGAVNDPVRGYPNYAHTLDPNHQVVSSELVTREEMLETHNKIVSKLSEQAQSTYTSPLENIYDLKSMGAYVLEGLDATQPYLPNVVFDRIIFENPHTNVYGNKSDHGGLADANCVASNRTLLERVFNNAKGHLTQNGELQILIAGWPFKTDSTRTQTWNKGMQLDNQFKAAQFGASLGWKLVGMKDKGQQWVRRNNGEYFQSNVVKLSYQEAT